MSDITELDLAWERISGLSGKSKPSQYNDFASGINHAVDQALFIIEELGGSDPSIKRAEAARLKAELMRPFDEMISSFSTADKTE